MLRFQIETEGKYPLGSWEILRFMRGTAKDNPDFDLGP